MLGVLDQGVAPLYAIKADLFKGLAHPLRIRILEVLVASPDYQCGVSDLLAATGLEASHLSQHLATLRRHRVVASSRAGSAVTYRLAHPKVAELLAIARVFLRDTLAENTAALGAVDQLPAVAPEYDGW